MQILCRPDDMMPEALDENKYVYYIYIILNYEYKRFISDYFSKHVFVAVFIGVFSSGTYSNSEY